jgi:hypothetical protein
MLPFFLAIVTTSLTVHGVSVNQTKHGRRTKQGPLGRIQYLPLYGILRCGNADGILKIPRHTVHRLHLLQEQRSWCAGRS